MTAAPETSSRMKNQRRSYHVGAHAGEDVDLRGLVALLRVALQVRREVWSGVACKCFGLGGVAR